MGFSSLNESFSLISFSYSINGIRVIRRECALSGPSSMVSFAHQPTSLNINVYITEALLSVTTKCNLKKISACVMRILYDFSYTFAIRCQFNDLYFDLFHRIFFLFHIHMKIFFIISMKCLIHLALLHPLILIWPWNWYRVPAAKPLVLICMAFMITLYPTFSSSFLISSYLLFLYYWLYSIRVLYGTDNSTMIILRFVLDRRTISGHRPLLDIVFDWV